MHTTKKWSNGQSQSYRSTCWLRSNVSVVLNEGFSQQGLAAQLCDLCILASAQAAMVFMYKPFCAALLCNKNIPKFKLTHFPLAPLHSAVQQAGNPTLSEEELRNAKCVWMPVFVPVSTLISCVALLSYCFPPSHVLCSLIPHVLRHTQPRHDAAAFPAAVGECRPAA